MSGRRRLGGDLRGASLVAAGAASAGVLLAGGHARWAIGVTALPALALLAQRFRLAAVLLAVALPFPASLLGDGSGINVAASDLLLAGLVVVVAGLAWRGRLAGLGRALRPAVFVCAPYVGWAVVLLAAHPALSTLLQTGQRLELFLAPILVGAAIAHQRHHWLVLRAYVLATTVVAALYPFFSTGDGGVGAQKNPAGQFMANALILLVALRPLRTPRMLAAVPVLTVGLLWTQSRGAVLSVVIAVIVLAALHTGWERRRLMWLLVPLAACVAGAFTLLPDAAQQRNTDFSVASGTDAARSLEYRAVFAEQAWRIVRAEPVVGVGLGNYPRGVFGARPTSDDPHQVLLLQAAEGGYPLAVAFVVLVGGAAVVLWRRRRSSPLAAAAAAVLMASVAHGFVDVYWVRGTPVVGWLLVGMVVGLGSSTDRGRAAAEEPGAVDLAAPGVGGRRGVVGV